MKCDYVRHGVEMSWYDMVVSLSCLPVRFQAVQQLEKPTAVPATAQQPPQEPPPRATTVAAAAPSSASSVGSEADGAAGPLQLH